MDPFTPKRLFLFLILSSCLACREPHLNTTDPLLNKMLQGFSLPDQEFVILDTGKNEMLDYADYGEFLHLGKSNYDYRIRDKEKLKQDAGAGIYPNQNAVRNDPDFKVMSEQGLLNESHWKLLDSDNKKLAFYKWATVSDDPGVKAYFTGVVLEKSGHILQAIKAYYSAIVHFPRSAGWARDQSFVWYIAPAAIGAINRLSRDYPSLNLEYIDSYFKVTNGEDTNLANDIIEINPGRFIKKTFKEKIMSLPDLTIEGIAEQRGNGTVRLVKYGNGHWQLLVDGKPFIVNGVTYGPTEIGIGPQNDPNFDSRWMFSDKNNNGLIDAPYEAWVDKNANGRQDPDELPVGDFQLMKEMGVNAVRLYIPNKTRTGYDPQLINKELLRDMHKRFGIRVIAGDFLGAYTVGSGADWNIGTDYEDPEQRAAMKEMVRQKVLDLKDEPFILMWLLGNENNMPLDYTGVNATRTKAALHPQAYAEFLNEVALMIHELDPDHPVAVGNVRLGLIDFYNQYAPAIDILGVNAYPGAGGFGTMWEEVKRTFDRPVLVTEYGADAYDKNLDRTNEDAQRDYYFGNLRDIVLNQAGGPYAGNSIGGVIFEYLDEWWKDTHNHPVDEQQTAPQFPAAFFDGYDHEEWFGIIGQGSGRHSPFERRLRETYFMFKECWSGK